MTTAKDKLSQTIRLDIPPDFLKKTAGKSKGDKPKAETSKTAETETRHGLLPEDTNFHELFQRVYDGAIIVDLQGQIVAANERASEFLQFPRAALEGMKIVAIISGADESLIQTLRTNLEQDLFTLIQAYCTRKDGSFFPAEIAVNRLKLSGEDYFCFFIRDITLRRQAEELLRIEHNAIQNAGNGIAIATMDGRFEFANPALLRLWDYAHADDIIGHHVRELFSDASVPEAILARIREGRTWSGRAVARRRDKSEFHTQISAAGNRNTDDELVSLVLSFTDISDARRADEAERQTERQRVMMESLGTACHHLGQPATVVLASLEVIQKLTTGTENQTVKEVLDSGMEAAESLREMLHKLNAMTEYKTKPYLQYNDGANSVETRILDFPSNPPNG